MVEQTKGGTSRYFIQKTYSSYGDKTIKISNNLLTMNANGGLTGNELTSQMRSIRFGSKFTGISPSCFVDCARLSSATLNAKCLEIGDAAFKNCTSLKYVNCLEPNTQTIVTQIGNEAFRNTGLEDIDVQLSNGGSYGATCGSYAFADCTELTSVKLERNPYLGEYMFQNCTNLKKFSMANSHSYVGRNAFENCVSLKEVTFPKNFYWLTQEMFKGCVNLSKVTFEETSQLKTVDNDVFSGCNSLTAITLPSSVDSLTYIDDNFLRGSKVSRVVFNGLEDKDIATEYSKPQEYTYSTNKIYDNLADIKNITEECQKNNIPLIAITNKSPPVGCDYCKRLNSFLTGTEFQNWLASNTKYMVVEGDRYVDSWGKDLDTKNWEWVIAWDQKNSIKGIPKSGSIAYATMAFYWKKEDGTVSTKGLNYADPDFNEFKSCIDEVFSGYERNTEMSVTINPQITKFGSDLSAITIVSKTGTEFTCTKDNETTYQPKVRIDYDTVSGFRFGIWYYNAKQLKEYADSNNIPVFLEFSSATCEPCQDFKENTFNNQEFQTAMKQKKCLLCRVELEGNERWTTPGTQPYFCVNSWGDSSKSIPQTVYYWKKQDGTTIKNAYWYNYRTDPVNSTYQTVLKRVDDLTAGYVPDPEINLEPPAIETLQEKKCFRYANQNSDFRGTFFICDKKTSVDEVTVAGGITIGSVTENTLTKGKITMFPEGYTYMWYNKQTDYMYDRSGVIFKVGIDGTISYIFEFENSDETGGNYQRQTDGYQTGMVYEMTQETPESSLETILEQAKFNQTQINILKLDGSDASKAIEVIVDGQDFQNYASTKNMLFLKVVDSSGTWSQNTPRYLKRFQTTPQEKQADPSKVFEPTTVHGVVPCIMVYEGCSQCTVDGSTVEYKKSNYDLTGKDMSYIRWCIEEGN